MKRKKERKKRETKPFFVFFFPSPRSERSRPFPFFSSLPPCPLLSPFLTTMAKKGAQRILEENKRRIRVLTALVAVSIVRFFSVVDQAHPRQRPLLSLSLSHLIFFDSSQHTARLPLLPLPQPLGPQGPRTPLPRVRSGLAHVLALSRCPQEALRARL